MIGEQRRHPGHHASSKLQQKNYFVKKYANKEEQVMGLVSLIRPPPSTWSSFPAWAGITSP